MVSDDREKNILNIMKTNGNIAANISKFGANTIERFNARGVKGIIIAPIYNEGKIDGALSIDYISDEKFEMISEMPAPKMPERRDRKGARNDRRPRRTNENKASAAEEVKPTEGGSN